MTSAIFFTEDLQNLGFHIGYNDECIVLGASCCVRGMAILAMMISTGWKPVPQRVRRAASCVARPSPRENAEPWPPAGER